MIDEFQLDGIVRMFVLNVVADGYENLDMMLKEAKDFERRYSISIQLSDVLRAVTFLIERGWIKAYDLKTQREAIRIEGVPPLSLAWDYYYYQTETGKHIHALDSSWPLDEEGHLKSEWSAPK